MAAIGIFPGVFRDVAHKRIHSEAAGHHCRTHCQTSHILTVFGNDKDSGIQQTHDVVGSRYGTGGR